MTREEIKKRVLSDECYLDAIAELVADIVADEKDYIESRPKFRQNEIVWISGIGKTHARYGDLDDVEKERAKKLSTKEFAETNRPPDAETWQLCDNEIFYLDKYGKMCRNSNGYYRTYCPHDGEAEGTL